MNPLFRSKSVSTDGGGVESEDEDGSRFRESSLALVNRFGDESERQEDEYDFDFDFDVDELEGTLSKQA
jgi:hypothetical protein